MKLTRPGVTHFSLALLLALCAAPACNGDDSTPVGTGGSAPEAGPDSAGGAGGSAGLGGSAGGSANTGGQVGTGGSSGAGGSAGNDGSAGGDASVGDARSDVTADVRSDVSATTDASDASRSDASDAAIVDAAPEASAGPCPVLAGDGGDAGDGGVHYQLYSFSGATSTADLAAWSTFMMGPVVSSTDDSTPESSTPGSLHATITYSGYNTFPVLESYHAVPLDFSCFTRLHISVKFTTAVNIPFVDFYVTSMGTTLPGNGFFTSNLLPSIADGNWHEIVADLNAGNPAATKTAIQRMGFQLFSGPQSDGGPATPPAIDIFIDNVWLE